MAANYVINFTDPAITPLVIGPGTTNTQNSVTLYGMGVQSYGEGMNKNLLHLLENFAYATAPTSPVKGQLWYDTVNEVIKVYDGAVWKGSNGVFVGITAPSSPVTGQLWYDTDISDDGGQFTVSQLKIYNGSAWVSVASNYVLKTGDTMTGALVLNADPLVALGAATKQYVDNTTVSLAGDTMTGALILSADPLVALGAATKQYVDNTTVSLGGDTMTGALILNADPTVALGAATKQYTDTRVLKSGDSMTGTLNMSGNIITSVGNPVVSSDAVNLQTGDARYAIIGPGTPKDGDIQVVGSVVRIYAAGSWRQVFPAQYS